MSWFKVPTNILRDGSILTRPNDALVLLVLLSRAQWKEGPVTYKGRDCWLKEGEVCISQNDLASATELSRDQIRLILDRFKRAGILIKSPPQGKTQESRFFRQANPQAKDQANPQAKSTEVPIFFIDLEPIINPKPPSETPSETPSKSPSTPQVPPNRPRGSEAVDSPHLPFSQVRVEAPARKKEAPDPNKFLMSASWTMTTEFDDQAAKAYRDKLGVEAYWRQIARFIDFHTKAGTIGTQVEHEKRLQGWLKNADRNIDHG